MDSNKCVATLEGHSFSVSCLENIDENRFASGSGDKTIKVWSTRTFDCLKTFVGHQVTCLKSLPMNRIASGSYKEIKIWDLDSGDCLQTLKGHTFRIGGIICLPNGNLVSCSADKTIKVWDLDRGECIQTLKGHTNGVRCIVLLRNGYVASSSSDQAIMVWDLEKGKCIKDFRGDSGLYCQLQVLESGELISSKNKTIQIWNVMEDICIRILSLVGHTASVSSIIVNSQNNTLISCGSDGTIITWNPRTGECLNQSVVIRNQCCLLDLILLF